MLLTFFLYPVFSRGEVKYADDGPKPLTPGQSAKAFQLQPGFHIDLVASEPLIQAPSGICWDEAGRLYVSELHGYNLEGHYDIEELNKKGQLDKVVRRIQANEEAKKKAEANTYGVIKQLFDENSDGLMDRVVVFAKDLPPCFGMVPARKGIIAVCAPHIIYLADTDNDGVSDIREILFSGFEEGVLERRINAPQWGLDNWIYIGSGGKADRITGPHLNEPVALGKTDFRIKPDGSAIEAVGGQTGTFGHTFTAGGDRITISTGTPGYQVIPLPWRYLSRNSELAITSMERNAASYQKTFPISKPHPWRTRRYEDPGFSKYYTDRYGLTESVPSGYFTSACSPFVYRDTAFPEYFRGANFTCEPAQNLVHLSLVRWNGPVMQLVRGGIVPDPAVVKAWAQKLTSNHEVAELPITSPWQILGPFSGLDKNSLFNDDLGPEKLFDKDQTSFAKHWEYKNSFKDDVLIDLGLKENAAIYLFRTLTSQEEGAVYASLGSNDGIKFWLNGELLLENNVNRSLAADQERVVLPLRKGTNSVLMKIVNGNNSSGFYFKLKRSLIPEEVRKIINENPALWDNYEYKLVENYYQSAQSETTNTEFLASTDSWFHPINLTHGPDGAIYITDFYREIIEDYSAIPRYLQQQYGLINGMHHGRVWRLSYEKAVANQSADLSGLSDSQLASKIGSVRAWQRETARRLLIENQSKASKNILKVWLNKAEPAGVINALYTLDGLGILDPEDINKALFHDDWSVRRHALIIGDSYPHSSPVKSCIGDWLANPAHYGNQPRLLLQIALSLGEFNSDRSLSGLLFLVNHHIDISWMDIAILSSTSNREEALLSKLLDENSHNNNFIEALVKIIADRKNHNQIQKALISINDKPPGFGLEKYSKILRSALSAELRGERLEVAIPLLPSEEILKNIEKRFPSFLSELSKSKPTKEHNSGRDLFTNYCSVCHQSRGVGQIAGPNLDSEFQRAPETILRDILFPNEAITEGYQTVRLEMRKGPDFVGLFSSESPTSVTLSFPGGQLRTLLKKDIENMTSHPVSLMPSNFAEILKPTEIASIINFLRSTKGE